MQYGEPPGAELPDIRALGFTSRAVRVRLRRTFIRPRANDLRPELGDLRTGLGNDGLCECGCGKECHPDDDRDANGFHAASDPTVEETHVLDSIAPTTPGARKSRPPSSLPARSRTRPSPLASLPTPFLP